MSLPNLGIDAFLSVYQHKTVLEASRHLGITQTGVTQRIRLLEKEVGTTLFLRSRKGMKLTEAGEKLLMYALQKQSIEQETLSKIRNEAVRNPINLNISASTYFMYSRVLPITKELKEKFPYLFFSFDVNDQEDKIQRLKRGDLDFTFLPREEVPLEFDSKLLKKATYVLVGGSKFKNFKEELPIIDFSISDPFTTNFFKKLNLKFNSTSNRNYLNNTLMIPKLIEDNLGVAVLDIEHFKEAKKNFKIFNLYPQKSYQIEWALVWHPRPEIPPYMKSIINLIK